MTANRIHHPGTIVGLVDQYAIEDPSRVWATVPVDESDLSKGFKDVTYTQLATAVNHVALWMVDHLPNPPQSFDTIAYAGPKDVRYPIIELATAKVGRKLLLPSPYASSIAQAHLIDSSGCSCFLYAPPLGDKVKEVLSACATHYTMPLEVLSLEELLTEHQVTTVPFDKTWDEAESEPWLVFHTSGTTGLPKLVTYTHRMMASLSLAEQMPDADSETMNRRFKKKRWYTPLPSLHFVGMTVALQFTVYFSSILVVGPATPGPASPQTARDVMRHGKVNGALMPPALIDGLCEEQSGINCLRGLKYLYFAGAPMNRKTAEKLIGHVPVKPAMGSTEAGAYFIQILDDEDWEYYSFRPAMGVELRRVSANLFEPVFVRQPDVEKFQQVFQVYPDLYEFPTKDLFSPHPSKPDRWKYVGRTDDLVVFSHGESLYATVLEEILVAHLGVSVLVGGQGRARPFALIDWKKDPGSEYQIALNNALKAAGESCSDLVKLREEMVLIINPEKPFPRTVKGSIARRDTERLYEREIEHLYEN